MHLHVFRDADLANSFQALTVLDTWAAVTFVNSERHHLSHFGWTLSLQRRTPVTLTINLQLARITVIVLLQTLYHILAPRWEEIHTVFLFHFSLHLTCNLSICVPKRDFLWDMHGLFHNLPHDSVWQAKTWHNSYHETWSHTAANTDPKQIRPVKLAAKSRAVACPAAWVEPDPSLALLRATGGGGSGARTTAP